MEEIILKNKEIINILFGLAIGIIPAFFDIRKSNGKRTLNWKGGLLIFICMSFILFSWYTIHVDNNKLKPNDIVLKFSLRSPTPFSTYEEISNTLPKEIFTPHIKIENSITSGIFNLENIRSGKAHSMESKFVNYVCYISGNKSIENFPQKINDLNPENVVLNISLKKYLDNGYTLNGSPKLIIRDTEYIGDINSFNNEITFLKK
ncbi:hypothetical protein [Sphingobacterium faecium]|uniref:hypothetical protein n=1 Tax=Sphingobacterium faecium TaxID=34087 RepID=UPI0032086DF7